MDLNKINENINRLLFNISEQNRKTTEMFFSPIEADVELQQLDENGNLTKVLLPNRIKILQEVKKYVPVGFVFQGTCYSAPEGFIKANGAVLNRSAYKDLWAFAEKSGNIVTEEHWFNGRYGSYSIGDNATTFRIPDLRGEFLRGLDDGRNLDLNRIIGLEQGDAIMHHEMAFYFSASNTRINELSKQDVFKEIKRDGVFTHIISGEVDDGLINSEWGNSIERFVKGKAYSPISDSFSNYETRPKNIAYPYFIKY